jgi:TRAP-type mannitol/chloroaromatic compound transport system permease large subunit
LVAPRLAGVDAPRAITIVSIAATIGVVVPPSLVLILLGDAMMRAHTEASNLPGYTLGAQRIVNTQDVFHAALVPALAVLALWAAMAWWRGRSREPAAVEKPSTRAWFMAAITAGTVLALLGSVFMGWMFAVEAAATGGCLVTAVALICRWMDWKAWRETLAETMALSGALFALLVGATMFSLVFRLFGTDRWLAQLVLESPWPPLATSVLVLLAIGACAIVLDAFEMIFVIVPIAAPLLIVRMGDAQQVAVLLLLVLQCSFLLPPLGYAVLMARARSGLAPVPTRTLLGAIAPFVAAQLIVMAAVIARPAIVHWLDEPVAADTAPPLSDEEISRQMREMAPAEAPND